MNIAIPKLCRCIAAVILSFFLILVSTSESKADMVRYKQCRQQAFADMALSVKTPFFVLGLANHMNDCLKYLTPEQRSRIERERGQESFTLRHPTRKWG